MEVVLATEEDIPGWLGLAAEVESLFGPMVDDPSFRCAVSVNIGRSQAHCVREGDRPPGAPLMGAMIFDERRAPEYEISWLAVSARHRGHGVGRCLVNELLGRASRPSNVRVVTFGADVAGGEPARRLFIALGFLPHGLADRGPEGGSREVFRLALD